MKNILFLCCLISILFFTSCDPDDGGILQPTNDVNLNFKAHYGAEPLVMNQEYTYEDGTPIKFTRFQFYLSNTSFLQNSGDDITEVSEIDLVNFTDILDEPSAHTGFTLDMKNVPIGDYAAIQYGLGVAPDLNGTRPNEYGANHVLGETADYWDVWGSYIFAKIEGRVDLDGDGTFEQGVIYHLGGDAVFRPLNKPVLFSIDEELGHLVNFNVDLKKIFVRNDQDFLDIRTNTSIEEESELANYIMDNFGDAITVEK